MGWTVIGARRLLDGFAGICPGKWMGHRVIVVSEEAAEFLLQICYGSEVAPAHDLPHDDSKHSLNLVQPRTVLGQIHEPDVMGRITQKSASCRLRFENVRFAFFFRAADPARNAAPPIPPVPQTSGC